MPLTDIACRTAKPSEKPYKLTDGAGLYLLVNTTGSKLWRLKYRIGGKEGTFSIGSYPTTSLADARQAALEAKKQIKQGIHPGRQRRAAMAQAAASDANTFKAVAEEWIAKKTPHWTGYYNRQVARFLASDVYPHVGNLPIRAVTAADLLAILQRAENRGAHSVAILIRQWSSAIFRYAVATLRADGDPAAALKGAVTKPPVVHRTPLTKAQITALLEALKTFGGDRETAIALNLLLLLFTRPGELRQAEWSEIDFDGAEWRIPPEKMKMRDMHIVPLSSQAMELLRELRLLTGHQRWLFPNTRRPDDCMNATTLNRALERLGFNGTEEIDFSAHGVRATASTMLNELGYRPDVIERQLAHKERNAVRHAYNRAEYLPERRKMMQDWSDYIAGLASSGNVIPIKAA